MSANFSLNCMTRLKPTAAWESRCQTRHPTDRSGPHPSGACDVFRSEAFVLPNSSLLSLTFSAPLVLARNVGQTRHGFFSTESRSRCRQANRVRCPTLKSSQVIYFTGDACQPLSNSSFSGRWQLFALSCDRLRIVIPRRINNLEVGIGVAVGCCRCLPVSGLRANSNVRVSIFLWQTLRAQTRRSIGHRQQSDVVHLSCTAGRRSLDETYLRTLQWRYH